MNSVRLTLSNATMTALIFVAALSSNVSFAQPTGDHLRTLFYSPTERIAMALARKGDNPIETSTSLSVNGLVKREQHKGTVWLNGHSVAEGQVISSGPAPVITNNGISINNTHVRVGERIDLSSGERTDFIPQGSVTIKRNK